MLSECLGDSSIRIGVLFIVPRQLGAVEANLEGQSCLLTSGAPDSYCSCPVHDFFPYREQPTVGPWDWLAHRTLSSAHRTVRCAQPTVGATTCHAKIAWPTVGAGDRWLTQNLIDGVISLDHCSDLSWRDPWCFFDEDITSIHTMNGPITRSRARQLNLQVHSTLVDCVSELTLGAMDVLMIRNLGEDQRGLGKGLCVEEEQQGRHNRKEIKSDSAATPSRVPGPVCTKMDAQDASRL
jgi:hypothetical protein